MDRSPASPRPAARAIALAVLLALFTPPAARAQFVNAQAGEPAGANQSYPSLAELNGIFVAAFSDFRTGSTSYIRCSYSTDSGATWMSLGEPPAPGTAHWKSDPRVVASPVAGKFFVFGGANDYPVTGAMMAFVPLSFPGGVPQWGTPGIVRVTWPQASATGLFAHDAAVSPTTGRLFAASLTWDEQSTHHLDVQWSDDQGLNWSAPLRQDSVRAWPILRVRGNRLYLMNGSGTPAVLAVTAASAPSWWAYGNPPKSRPAMTTGLSPGGRENHFDIDDASGRIHAVWAESYDFEDDPIPDPILEAGPVSEVEPNETFATAMPFQVGDVLRGAIGTSTTDVDHFRVHLDAGQRVILSADSVDAAFVSFNLLVSDTMGLRPAYQKYYLQREERVTFVAARTDDYDFRLGGTFSGSALRGYRVRTAAGATSATPALDQCDLMTAWSDDDGATWSPAVRANVSPAGLFDDGPILEVTAAGRPQIGYWARTPTGGVLDARWRLLRSNDAGASWQSGLRLTITPNTIDWSMLSAIQYGMNAMLALPGRIVHAFEELQNTPTVQTDIRARRQLDHVEVAGCGANYAGGPGDMLHFAVMVTNADSFFTEPVRVIASFDRNWPSAEDTVFLPRAATSLATLQYGIPDTAAAGTVGLQLVVAHFNEGLASCPVSIYVSAGAGVEGEGPAVFGLGRVAPNPAGGPASVRYALPSPAWATLDVLDVHGRRVARLADRLHEGGRHALSWDGRGAGGARLPAGVYLVELRSGGRRDVERLVLLD